MQKRSLLILLFSFFVLVALNNQFFAVNYTFSNRSLTLSNTTGCAISSYTFSQKTANNNNAKISSGVTVTVVFPAGVNISTATMAGSTFKGTAITAGWTISGQTLTFTSPINVGKDRTFSIVIANVTNGGSTNANATVSMPNQSGGTSSGTYLVTTTACPTIPTNNECTGSASLTPAPSGGSTCTTINGTTFGATASALTSCAGIADDDVWYSFVANNANHQVTVDGGANFNAVVQVFSGACPSGMTSLSCADITGGNGIETVSLSGLTIGNTYYVRVYHSGTGPGVSAANSFTICVTSSSSSCNIGSGNLTAATLPYTSGAQTTCSSGNDITSSNVSNICGSSSYYGGLDKVIEFTPLISGTISINLTSTGSWVGMMLYQGCPTSGGICVANAQSSAGNQSIGCVPVVGGLNYYLVVDSYPAPNCNPFNVTISAPSSSSLTGTICSNAVNMTFPYSATNQSTLCYGNDYTNASIGSPSTLYESGEDKVYSFTTTGPQCLNLILSNASTDYIGFQVYSGCPGVIGTTCVASGGGATSGSLASSFVVPDAGTYYLVIDTWSAPSFVNYDLVVTSTGSGPSNDLPCNAESLILGTSIGGENNCSGSASEPGVPGCWSSGSINSVWYKVTVPASGKVKIKTTQGSLLNTQIAVYTGTCGSLTLLACNDNAASCASFSTLNSELSLTGLTVGNTIFIRVDGNLQSTGTFSILAIDGDNSFPSIPGQDCGDPNPVCNTVMSISNPGYSGFGNTCDLPTSYCLASGERNIVWYRIPISTAGTFDFNIVPNDFSSVTENGTDYDFAIWKIAETGGTLGTDFYNCSQIAAGTAPPEACNYSFLGVTGVGPSGNPPTSLATTVCPTCPGGYNPISTFSGSYEPNLTVAVGDVYLLAVSNYTSSTSGFRINFTGTSVIDFAASLSVAGGVTWSGGNITTPTLWTDPDNWGGCATPICSRDAFVAPFTNQPILLSGQTYTTKDLIIQAGATLTLQANSTLEICGNFTNFGSISADPTSTIIFKGTGTQAISGNFTSSNRLGNLTITKVSGNVILFNDLDLGGTFTTSSISSIFNSNGKQLTISKDFLNFSGNTTFTNTGTSGKLEFNGNGSQNYDQGLTQLNLNGVILSNSGGIGSGVNLLSNMFIKANTGTLTLNQGTISTNSYAVNVLNTSVNSVSGGSTISFIDGNLTRSLNSTGSYDWPVGNVSKGYQRANSTFLTSTIGSMTGRFDDWPSGPGYPPIYGGSDCGSLFGFGAQDNGYWTLTANSGASTNYDLTLYPIGSLNTAGTSNWTIIKKPSLGSGSWSLSGTCAPSTVSQVNRTGMSGFSVFGIGQSVTPLPIELLSFTGRSEGASNYLEWITATEINNDYFTLERSADGIDFNQFAVVDGAGNSNSSIHYDKYDHDPFVGVTYYRLKQTDFNGMYTYSNIVALANVLDKVSMGGIHPNPTAGNISFDFFSPKNGVLQIRMIDNAGRIVLNEMENIVQDQTKINFSISHFAKGEYTLEVVFEKGDFSSQVKVVKN
jgi:hypothetical protein